MDRRVKYTKNVIKESFLELLRDKDITKITVMELCHNADINRATFYRYYLDIFDLLDKLEDEFILEFKNTYKDYNYTDNNLYDYVLALLEACEKNKTFVKVLFKSKNSIIFLNEVLDDAYLRCREKWMAEVEGLSDEEIEYATAYIFNGTIGVVNYWIQNDFDKDTKEIAGIVRDLCYFGTEKFIYKK